MTIYTLHYARVVYLEHKIEADSYVSAMDKAFELENSFQLGLDSSGDGRSIIVSEGSEIEDINDYDVVWEVTPDDEEDGDL